MAEVKRTLSPEFINRIDEIIVFDALTEEQLREIARIMIDRLNEGLEERGIRVSRHRRGLRWLVETTCQDRSYGARPLRRAIQRHIEDALSEALIQGRFPDRGQIEVYLDGDRLDFRVAVETLASLIAARPAGLPALPARVRRAVRPDCRSRSRRGPSFRSRMAGRRGGPSPRGRGPGSVWTVHRSRFTGAA